VEGIETATGHRQERLDDASAPEGRRSPRSSAGVLAELGGGAVEVAGQSASVVLTRGEVWRSTRDHDAALVAVEEGFVLISADTRHGTRRVGPVGRRIVVATGQRGVLLVPPGSGERLEALTMSRITIISGDSLRFLLGRPSVAEAICAAFVEALQERQATIRNCAYVRHSERVLEKLLQLARTYGRVVPGGVRIDFPLTHQLLADMVGSARETVSLALSDLAREGFLHRRHGRYVLNVGLQELFSGSCGGTERARRGRSMIDPPTGTPPRPLQRTRPSLAGLHLCL
jgi:CRP-like cAMP-binding protein